MKQYLLLNLFLCSQFCFTQTFDVQWNDQFEKELQVSCSAQETFCKHLCHAESFCMVKEKNCTSCVGSSLPMYRLFKELGRTIRSLQTPVSSHLLIDLIINGHFATFTSRDVYNVIDGYNSIDLLKKFESLCPGESLNQVLFVELGPVSHRYQDVKYVSCLYEKESVLFEMKNLANYIRFFF
jgi:hypothetical protein